MNAQAQEAEARLHQDGTGKLRCGHNEYGAEHLENLAVVDPSFSEILQQTAREWNKQKLNKNHILQEFLQ
ncbi:MAG: hypothetical protein ACKO6M_00300, partial [Bacteroidota bacterium]